MQVAHGESLNYPPNQLEYQGRLDINQTPDNFHLNRSYENDERFAYEHQRVDIDQHPSLSDVRLGAAVAPAPLFGAEKVDCVSNLQLRAELLKVSSYLQRLAPDRVVVHNDPVADRLHRRLADGAETRAFVAFDVEELMDNWGYLQSVLPELAPTVRANAANHQILAALVGSMDVRVTVETLADVALLERSVQAMVSVDACSPHTEATRLDFSAACGLHTGVVRSATCIRRSLLAGVTQMCVGSLSGLRGIASAVNTAPKSLRDVMDLPTVVLVIKSSKAVAASFAVGTSVLKSQIASFSLSSLPTAAKEAQLLGLAVSGLQTDVSSLLDGTAKAALAALARSTSQIRKRDVSLVLDDLDVYLASENRDSVMNRIRSAVLALQTNSSTVTVSADVSQHLLGGNQMLLTRVIGARPSIGDDGSVIGRQFYVDDGIYGSLCSRAKLSSAPAFSVGYETDCPEPFMVKRSLLSAEEPDCSALPCTIWGQTCDSLDKVMVAAPGQIPSELGLGDWLSFKVPMCAGNGTNTGFNGYDAPLTRFMVHTGFE